jgi:CrcB protein
VVNVVGCLAIGALSEYCIVREALPETHLLAIRTGFLGGLTTFSTFAAESVMFGAAGRWHTASAYIAANVVLGIAGVVLASWWVRSNYAA